MSPTTRAFVLAIGLLSAAGCAQATIPDEGTSQRRVPTRAPADAAPDSGISRGGNLMGSGH